MLRQELRLEVQTAEEGAKNDIFRLPLGVGSLFIVTYSREVLHGVGTLGFSALYFVVRLSIVKLIRPSRKGLGKTWGFPM